MVYPVFLLSGHTVVTTGPGVVASSPSSIYCGADCTASFDEGAMVTLTATPYFLSVFEGWRGCDTVSGATCTVTVTAARSVTAKFLP